VFAIGVVRGVAVLKGLLYVVCELSPIVHVFDMKTFKRLEDIKVPNMDDPNDVPQCPTWMTQEIFQNTQHG